MKNSRKSVISAGAFALSMAIVSISANVSVAAKGKSDTIKPNPPSVAKGKSATIPVELPSVDKGKSATIPVELPTVAAPATEKGIKDKGMTSCGNCGLTGRVAAPPPVDDAAAPSAEKAGRPKERDDSPHDTSATQRGIKSIPGVKHSKTSSLLKIGGGLAALSAVIALAASGGDDKPASP